VLDDETSEWWLAVETTEARAWCPSCGIRAVGHGRRRVKIRDLPMADRPVVLVWAKRLWRCPEPACATRTWSEESDEIGPRAVLTERARAEITRRVGPGEQSVARTARDFGVGWHAAMAAVWDHGQPRVDHLARLGAPVAIGLDETSFLAATATHPTLLVTGIVDLDAGRLVDVLPARSARAVTDWLESKPKPWRAGIRHMVIDPYQPYATAVARALPEARLVVDHFHVVRLANAALDEVRRRVQHTTLGHRGRKNDPLVGRRLAARSACRWELPIEILEEVDRRADDEPTVAYWGGVSPGTRRCSALARILSRNAAGTWSRSVRTLALKRVSCSAGISGHGLRLPLGGLGGSGARAWLVRYLTQDGPLAIRHWSSNTTDSASALTLGVRCSTAMDNGGLSSLLFGLGRDASGGGRWALWSSSWRADRHRSSTDPPARAAPRSYCG
jgi:hypothetical protein